MKKLCTLAALVLLAVCFSAAALCESTYVTVKAILSDSTMLGTPFVAAIDSTISYLDCDFTDHSVMLVGKNSSGVTEFSSWSNVEDTTSMAIVCYFCENFSSYHNSSNDWIISMKLKEDEDRIIIRNSTNASKVASIIRGYFN